MYKKYQDEQFYTNGIQKKVEWLISNLYPKLVQDWLSFSSKYTVELQWLEHGWLVYYGCFELVLESLGPKSHSCRFRILFRVIFFFISKMIYCAYSLESPRWGDSNENTQHTFMFKKIEKLSLLGRLTWRYNQPSFAPLSRTNFHGPKGVRAIEVRLYIENLPLNNNYFVTWC